jgi:hypothetical protein
MRLLEESIGKNFKTLPQAMIFWGRTPKAQETKTQIDEWNYIKLRSFYRAKKSYE